MGRPHSTRRLLAGGTLGRRAAPDGRRCPPALPPALLAPMVRRAVATGRGPAGLLLWLRCRVTTWPVPRPTERFVLALTAELLGAMADSRGGMPKKSGGG